MAGSDDLLTPEEIEALMSAARSSGPGGAVPSAPASSAAGRSPAPTLPPPQPAPDRLLEEAEQHLAAVLAGNGSNRKSLPDTTTASAYRFENFEQPASRKSEVEFPIAALQDVELDLRIELGRTELLIEEVLQLREGAVVPLDKLAGDPVDILVNGRLIARGEVLVLNDNFCVRVAEILVPFE